MRGKSIESLLKQMNKYLEAKNQNKFFEVGQEVKKKLREMGLYTLNLEEIWRSKTESSYEFPSSTQGILDFHGENPYDDEL